MDTTFYPEASMADNLKGKMNMLRSKMTLDFNNGSPPAKKKTLVQLLASPDLNMLKLASPELEKMIIQHNGLVTTTPTPTQILFPKSVTEEQEAYARGFMDALAKLHKTEDGEDSTGASVSSASIMDTPPSNTSTSEEQTFTTLQNASHKLVSLQNAPQMAYNFTTTTALPGSMLSTSNRASMLPSTVTTHSSQPPHTDVDTPRNTSPYSVQPLMVDYTRLKEEPQTVPSLNSTPPLSPMMSPINMDDQEFQKTERKRARNRVAARKCRYRKLERISRLEGKVNELRTQNTSLSGEASTLKNQVLQLKQQILQHVNSGCNIMMAGNVL